MHLPAMNLKNLSVEADGEVAIVSLDRAEKLIKDSRLHDAKSSSFSGSNPRGHVLPHDIRRRHDHNIGVGVSTVSQAYIQLFYMS